MSNIYMLHKGPPGRHDCTSECQGGDSMVCLSLCTDIDALEAVQTVSCRLAMFIFTIVVASKQSFI